MFYQSLVIGFSPQHERHGIAEKHSADEMASLGTCPDAIFGVDQFESYPDNQTDNQLLQIRFPEYPRIVEINTN